MWTRLWKDVTTARILREPPEAELTTEAELAALPMAARQYMKFFGVTPGSAKHWSFRLAWSGRFRLGPDRPWLPIEAVQYNTRSPIARLFHMKAHLRGILPVLARDTYVHGRGRMRAKIARLVTVADGHGHAFDEGELVTWLNDAVLFAPSMLLGPHTRWAPIDARSFEIGLSDHQCSVSARVTTDDRGAPLDFETSHRYLNDPFDPAHPLIRARWTAPIASWRAIGDYPFPRRGRATWHLERGDFTYADFEPDAASFALDLLPVRTPHRSAA